jgi:hypothetical protein
MKSNTLLGIMTLAGIGIAAFLLDSRGIDSFIESAEDEIQTFFDRAKVEDYVNSLDFSSREELYNLIRTLDSYSKQ